MQKSKKPRPTPERTPTRGRSANKPPRDAAPLVALLRGINVGGKKLVPMAELRELATKLGCSRVETYIQSGNLVLSSPLEAGAIEAALEQAIRWRFGFDVDVVVRTDDAWRVYEMDGPFQDARTARPNLVLLGLSKRPPKPGAADALRAYATAGEQIEIVGDAIWIDYCAHIATSKLSPAVLDRVVGSTVTARNWRTVQKLGDMLRAVVEWHRASPETRRVHG